jgi:predicted amidohydrolase YtcJ
LDPDTGQSPHGEEGWYCDQRLVFPEALWGFTIDAAYGAFQERIGGSIEVGKWADWVVVEEIGRGVEMGERSSGNLGWWKEGFWVIPLI